MTVPLRIPVVAGSVRRGRQSIRAARFAVDRLVRSGADATLVDLAELNLPIMEERLHKRDDPPPGLVRFSDTIASADAVVIVSPEYNGSMPGVLKNALDYIYGEWFRKPVGIVTVSAGGYGGVQLHNHLQLLFLRVKALPVAHMAVFQRVAHLRRGRRAPGGALREVLRRFRRDPGVVRARDRRGGGAGG